MGLFIIRERYTIIIMGIATNSIIKLSKFFQIIDFRRNHRPSLKPEQQCQRQCWQQSHQSRRSDGSRRTMLLNSKGNLTTQDRRESGLLHLACFGTPNSFWNKEATDDVEISTQKEFQLLSNERKKSLHFTFRCRDTLDILSDLTVESALHIAEARFT